MDPCAISPNFGLDLGPLAALALASSGGAACGGGGPGRRRAGGHRHRRQRPRPAAAATAPADKHGRRPLHLGRALSPLRLQPGARRLPDCHDARQRQPRRRRRPSRHGDQAGAQGRGRRRQGLDPGERRRQPDGLPAAHRLRDRLDRLPEHEGARPPSTGTSTSWSAATSRIPPATSSKPTRTTPWPRSISSGRCSPVTGWPGRPMWPRRRARRSSSAGPSTAPIGSPGSSSSTVSVPRPSTATGARSSGRRRWMRSSGARWTRWWRPMSPLGGSTSTV